MVIDEDEAEDDEDEDDGEEDGEDGDEIGNGIRLGDDLTGADTSSEFDGFWDDDD